MRPAFGLAVLLLLPGCPDTSGPGDAPAVRLEPGPAPAEPAPAPPTAEPAPTPATPRLKRKDCGKQELTGRGLPRSPMKNTLSADRTRGTLDSLNDLCGDVWCEGSFEWYFHGLTCDGKKKLCHLDVRMYHAGKTERKVEALKRKGKAFAAEVLAQSARECCTHPGITNNIAPCTVFDARCALTTGLGQTEFPERFHETLTLCLNALEDGVREIVPEFPDVETEPAAADPAGAPIEVSTLAQARASLGQTARVTGKAANAKLAAVVLLEGSPLYCLQLEAWPEGVDGRPVAVTGVLQQTDQFKAMTDARGAVSQGTAGKDLVFRRMSYEVISKP